MSDMHLSRATLRRDAATVTLAALLDPEDDSATLDAHHKLLWSLFADTPDRTRDFLWRTDGRGQFMLLSHRKPINRHALFDLETRAFEPALSAGDRLHFTLRANAVISRWQERTAGKRRVRHDIVMDAVHRTEQGAQQNKTTRSQLRDDQTQQAARQWMTEQGNRHGFTIEHVVTQAYRTQRVPRRKPPDARFGVLDMDGVIVVKEASLLLSSIAQGFGKAKAFGNGLMLIKRA